MSMSQELDELAKKIIRDHLQLTTGGQLSTSTSRLLHSQRCEIMKRAATLSNQRHVTCAIRHATMCPLKLHAALMTMRDRLQARLAFNVIVSRSLMYQSIDGRAKETDEKMEDGGPCATLPHSPHSMLNGKGTIFSEACSLASDKHDIPNAFAIVGNTFGVHHVYDTQVHRQIYAVLVGQLRSLSVGKYVGKTGSCCSVLVGLSGVGKTTSLHAFTTLARRICSHVVVIYVSCRDADEERSRLRTEPLGCLIWEQLLSHGIVGNPGITGPLCEAIIEALEQAKRYVLLLVDEFDQLCELDGSRYPAAVTTVRELAYFNSQPSGRLSVLACSSSSFIQEAMSTQARPAVRANFPLLSTGAADLSLATYQQKSVCTPLPTELKTVRAIVGSLGSGDPADIARCRLVAYLTGCCPRWVTQLLRVEPIDSDIVAQIRSDAINLQTDDNAIQLRETVLRCLVKKNRWLLRRLFGASTLSPAAIVRRLALVDWEETLLPLTTEEIEKCWDKLPQQPPASGELTFHLQTLVDAGCLTIQTLYAGRPHRLYPRSMSVLADAVLSPADAAAVAQLALAVVRDTTASAAAVVRRRHFASSASATAVGLTAALATGRCGLL